MSTDTCKGRGASRATTATVPARGRGCRRGSRSPWPRSGPKRQAVIGSRFVFGEVDGILPMEVPANPSVIAVAMTLGGTGAFAKVETTVLVSMDEAQDVMRKSAAASYRPPS